MVKVNIKWGKRKFENIDLDENDSAVVFKTQVWTLTCVPVERQKIMGVKGGILKDDADLSKLGIKEGQTLMLMGTAEEQTVVEEPKEKTVFVEDMPEDQQDLDAFNYPPGLVNLGNTCYMNSTLQCFKAVPELQLALKGFTDGPPGEGTNIARSLRDLYREMEGTHQEVTPMQFLSNLHMSCPNFAERSPQGIPMQQDAEECWMQILRLLNVVKGMGDSNSAVVDRLFNIKTLQTDKNTEDESEASTSKQDTVKKLTCHISKNTLHMFEGLREGLEENIEKNSETLGRTAVYTRSSRLHSLPPYLCVQFMRFFWKADAKVKAKILKNVSFPFDLDVYDLCSDELKEQLKPRREEARLIEEERLDAIGKGKGPEENKDEKKKKRAIPSSVLPNDHGHYELCAVLTHQGRTADSGHYVGWVKSDEGEWVKYDDDKVTKVDAEEVKKLSGGGDWHMAYLLLYRVKELPSRADNREDTPMAEAEPSS